MKETIADFRVEKDYIVPIFYNKVKKKTYV